MTTTDHPSRADVLAEVLSERELAYLSRAIFRQRADAPDDEPDLAAQIDPLISVARMRSPKDGPPPGYIIPEGDERCTFAMDACTCMKRKGHEGLHACAHGGWGAR